MADAIASSAHRSKLLSYLQLMRLPNCFTAMADVFTGYLVACGPHADWLKLLGLLISTCGIYAGGCVLNDLCDRQVDARERPFRPVPSKRVSIREAIFLCCALFGLGLLGAFLAGWAPFAVALLLVLLAASYDAFTKSMDWVGPMNMGACRSFNLILGMSPCLRLSGVFIVFALISFIYVISITLLSRYEVDGKPGKRGRHVLAGWLFVVSAIVALLWRGHLAAGGLVFLGLLILLTAPPLFRALLEPAPDIVGRAVKFMILAIPVLDAIYLSGVQGFAYGISAALFAVPPVYLSRYLYVT
jgi:4-hydroxybenzoate polyprenyltransferase